MGQQRANLKLVRQFFEIAIKHRDLCRAIAIGHVWFVARWVPRRHSKPGKVEHRQHLCRRRLIEQR